MMHSICKVPFEQLSPREKGLPLEAAFNSARISLEKNLCLMGKNLTHICNFKNQKDEHVPDFLIWFFAVIELKNWNSYTKNGDTVDIKNIDNQILPKFSKYPSNLKRVLFIAKPNWGKGAKEYLASKGIIIIELGFQVINTKESIEQASKIIEIKLTELLSEGEEGVHLDVSSSSSILTFFDDLSSIFRKFFLQFSVFKVKIRLKEGFPNLKTKSASGDSEHPELNSSKHRNESFENSILGEYISESTLREAWSKIESSVPLPKVRAFRIPKKELEKFTIDYSKEKSNTTQPSESASSGLERINVDAKGLSVCIGPDEYFIVIYEGVSEAEELEVLHKELCNVAWRDWSKVVGDKWKQYVR